LLSVQLTIGTTPTGPGLWRANPLLVRKPEYLQYLQEHLSHILLCIPSWWSPQKKWDHIKAKVKSVTRSFGIQYTDWRKKTLRNLQAERNSFLRTKPSIEVRIPTLATIDNQIASIQEELTDILALKSKIRWCEKGETSIKYLKNIYRTRSVEQHIATLRPNDASAPVGGIDNLLPIAQQFYHSLYATDPVDETQILHYLGNISDLPQLTEADCAALSSPITLDEILSETRKVVNKVSSPGADGLGYAYLDQLYRYPPLQNIILDVYNDALSYHQFPNSWQEIRVRLLSKKGDLTSLKNWRPISLINCDAKIFTRIINSRLRHVVTKLIQGCQTGFMANRFIADNELLLNIAMEHARQEGRSDIAYF
jgi:hypothetical protein